MSAIVGALIEQDRKEQAAEAARHAKRQQVKQQTLENARAALPDLIPETLRDEIAGYTEVHENGQLDWRIEFDVEHPLLGPFTIELNRQNNGIFTLNGYLGLAGHFGAEHLMAFLQTQRRQYIERRLNQLRRAENPEEVEQAHDVLVQIAPDQREDWDRALEEARQTLAIEKAGHQELLAYEAALRDYVNHQRAVKEHNEETLDILQQGFPAFPAYTLTYGVVAGEEGETYADTRTVTVLDDESDLAGYWRVLDRGRIEMVHYFHPVSVAPKNEPARNGVKVMVHEFSLTVPPGYEEIARIKLENAYFQSFAGKAPEAPEHARGSWADDEIRRRAWNQEAPYFEENN